MGTPGAALVRPDQGPRFTLPRQDDRDGLRGRFAPGQSEGDLLWTYGAHAQQGPTFVCGYRRAVSRVPDPTHEDSGAIRLPAQARLPRGQSLEALHQYFRGMR